MRIGIIGGTGLEDPQIMQDFVEQEVDTPYGKVNVVLGKIKSVDVAIISRHGKKHETTPTHVNNRANIYALKQLDCTQVIATTAVGSLREKIKPGDFVILDQLIDFTRHRAITFHETFEKGVEHVSLADPFSNSLRKKLIESAMELGMAFHDKGTILTIEGPRFSTRAESNVFRMWGADVINMSTSPEAILAREAGIDYAVIAMSTDYDCWKEGEEDVSIEMIFKRVEENAEKVKWLLLRTIEKSSEENLIGEDVKIIKDSIRTIPDFPKAGIMFRDITTLMKNKEAMSKVIEILVNRYKDKQVDVVAGIESRGFIFGAILAEKLNADFVPVRKPGKLPAEVVKEEYALEYGTDAVEIHKDAIKPGDKVLVIDDLIATGGTILASCNLIEKLGGEIIECAFVIELFDLKGKEKLKWPFFSVVSFEGE